MMPAETIELCQLVRAFCPSQAFNRFTPDAWHLLLQHVDYPDAQAAVLHLAGLPLEPGKARYIEPGHIIGECRRIRDKRLSKSTAAEPPPEVADDPALYVQWLRATHTNTRKAIA